MATFLDSGVYERDRGLALEAMGECLYLGEIALLLGSGCSQGVGLPGWKNLVNKCCEHPLVQAKDPSVTPFDPATSPKGDDFFQKMETVRIALKDPKLYVQIVQESLYGTLGDKLVTEPSRILRAIGALIMGSQRGKVSEVITLNFDCVLETYLTLHGFAVQVVESWPRLLVGTDVCIYHPHGYLPMKGMGISSEDIIFDSLSVDLRLGTINPWNELFKSFLMSRVILAIGLSGKDYLLRALLAVAGDEVLSKQARPLGFWLCMPDVEEATRAQLRARNIVPIPVKDPDDLADMLLNICRLARSKLLVRGENIL